MKEDHNDLRSTYVPRPVTTSLPPVTTTNVPPFTPYIPFIGDPLGSPAGTKSISAPIFIPQIQLVPEDPDPGKVVFKSGAARSKMMPWYSFVPRYFIERIAKVFEYGAKKYGAKNWQKGGQEFIDEIPDHIIGHVYAYVEEVNNGGDGKSKEDHLANIGCNLTMLMHFQEQGKYPQRTQG